MPVNPEVCRASGDEIARMRGLAGVIMISIKLFQAFLA